MFTYYREKNDNRLNEIFIKRRLSIIYFNEIYLSRVLEHFGVFRNEAHTDAGPVHFRWTAGVREGGWAS